MIHISSGVLSHTKSFFISDPKIETLYPVKAVA